MMLNLTGEHVLVIRDDGADELIAYTPGQPVAQVVATPWTEAPRFGVPTVSVARAVTGLPPAMEGVVLVVGEAVLDACPDRADLAAPWGPCTVRGDTGEHRGWRGLRVHPRRSLPLV